MQNFSDTNLAGATQNTPSPSAISQTSNAQNVGGVLSGLTAGADDSGGATTGADFESFLQLLTAQLRNQDPLSPLDSSEFVAQLASFSSVEQLVNANTQLDSIATALVGEGVDRYAGLIGREVELANVPGYFDGESLSFRIPASGDATRVEVTATNESGQNVASFTATNTNDLQQWRPEGLPPGQYRLSASYYRDDEVVRLENAVSVGRVEEIGVVNGAAVVRLEGGAEAPANTVLALRNVTE